ncbi:MAG: argininosuccinate lyase [Chitinispirillaceae bacterium]|nr:argininosuccinate lyase [Chitinispirillaceae bacterium]
MKMWDGRFSRPSDRLMEAFNNSLPFDRELLEEDIAGSLAWARAIRKAGLLTAQELKKIEKGLLAIAAAGRKGTLAFHSSDEDIHMAVERLLTEKAGTAGEKLHTGRSRNDQVATDTRLYVKKTLGGIAASIAALQKTLLRRAEKENDVVIPAYTHLQQAQPVLLTHYWLSFFFALERDRARVINAIASADQCPLGAGAVAGSGFPVDRSAIASELGFSGMTDNSIDAVASRDYLLEALAAIASTGSTLSRYAEDLIVWSSREFGLIELDDAWSSGSSMMPQKKNPDPLELIRGKCGRFIGNYTRLAVTIKGVGLAYCKDLQEDKEPLFDSVAHIGLCLKVFERVVATLSVIRAKAAANMDPLLFATDVADYLVTKGLPFRQAHNVVGRIVAYCVERKCDLSKLDLKLLQSFHPLFKKDVYRVFSWEQAIAHRDLPGGTGRKSVARQIVTARKHLGTVRRLR